MVPARKLFITAIVLVALSGCAREGVVPPSLAPRAAEQIDPRLPVERAQTSRPQDESLRRTIAKLVEEAKSGDVRFRAVLGATQRLANNAGKPQSESWIAAQQALSGLEAARTATARSLAEIDALGAERIHATGAVGDSDSAAIDAATTEVGAIDARQAAEIKAITTRLAR